MKVPVNPPLQKKENYRIHKQFSILQEENEKEEEVRSHLACTRARKKKKAKKEMPEIDEKIISGGDVEIRVPFVISSISSPFLSKRIVAAGVSPRHSRT